MTSNTRFALGLVALTTLSLAAGGALIAGMPKPATAAPAAVAPAASAAPADAAPDMPAILAKLVERTKADPDDLEGWQMLGRVYTAMGRAPDAVAAYRQVVRLAPKDAMAHAELGRALGVANGRKLDPEGEKQLNEALRLDPGNVMAHALLGRVSLDRGRPAEAKRHFEVALEHLDEGHPFAQQLRQAIQIASTAEAGQTASAPTR